MTAEFRHSWWGASRSIAWEIFAAAIAYTLHIGALLHWFVWRYVDSDQYVGASMARFYAQGYVPEPYFFGQAFNFPLESWLAVPLVALGIRPDIAVMLISGITVYGFFLAALFSVRTQPLWIRVCIAAAPLTMPFHFILVMLIPRNFGDTAAFAGLMCLVVISARKYQVVLAAALLLGIAAGANPSALIVVLAAMIFARTHQRTIFLGAGLGFLAIYSLKYFYVLHPSYRVFESVSFTPTLIALNDSLQNPLIWAAPVTALTSSALIPWVLTVPGHHEIRKLLAFVGGASALALTLMSIPHIAHFQRSVFLSTYRFWTAVPIALTLTVILLRRSLADSHSYAFTRTYAFVASLAFLLAGSSLAQVYLVRANARIEASFEASPGLSQRHKIESKCAEVASTIDVDHEYVSVEGAQRFLAYGCFALQGAIVDVSYADRRTWLPKYIRAHGLKLVPMTDFNS